MIKGDSEGQNGPEINRLRRKVNNLVDEEEMWWQQRSREQWLGEGDCNTKYFHHRALERRKKHTISRLWSEDEAWCESKESIANTVMAFFEDIYTSTHPTRIDEVTNMILVKVIGEMNVELTRDFTSEKVRTALYHVHPTKALSPNVMSAIFYQKYWEIVGTSVTNMVLNVLNSDALLSDINSTNIVLVLKVKNPSKMKDFHPISLSNVCYMLVSMVLANCLKAISTDNLGKSKHILPERLITDNVLVVFELIHYLDHKKSGLDSFMAIKLDMSKAYD